jgi:single-strand DNA-binding protein
MATTIIGTIGTDPELRFTQSGMQVMAVNLAVPYGMKDNEGNKPTQWYVATFWGKQAEKLHPYLQKGARISVTLKDLHN